MKQTPDIIQSKIPSLTARKKVKNSKGIDINPTVAVASTAVYWLFKFKAFIFLLVQINGAKMNLKSFKYEIIRSLNDLLETHELLTNTR